MAKPSRVRNILQGREKSAGLAALMTPRMILSLVFIGVFSFTALVMLSGYAGDIRQKNNGEAHALSRSAIGFGGLVRLLADMGYDVRMARTENVSREDATALRVFTMNRPYQADKMDDLGLTSPTLIIMPKWSTLPMQDRKGWVQKGWSTHGTFGMYEHERDLKELTGKVEFSQIAPGDKTAAYQIVPEWSEDSSFDGAKIESLQVISGDRLENVFAAKEGSVLVRLDGTSTYILSDPDLMNTMGISSRKRARFAVEVINSVIADAGADPMRVDFDITLHGFGGKSNIIKTLTQPPFLAATLCLLAAGGLIAWQAFSRFGKPIEIGRDYALGKFSLVDNAARFIRIAGREPNMAKDYADLIRKQVIKELNLGGRQPKHINNILLRREQALKLPRTYEDLRSSAERTTDNLLLMHLAEDLEVWKTRMILGDQK